MRQIIFAVILAVTVNVFSQMLGAYNHPQLKWMTYETEHFIFHYHEGTERTTLRYADIGEKVYGPVTSLYNYTPPRKINVIVADFNDIPEAGAYYYSNKMVLWAPAFETELRGNHFWHTNVFTHEFTHMIQLQLTRKTARPIPGLYFQWTGYEREKREDVLTGFPNVLASANLPFNIIPPWFAEGIAQIQLPDSLYFDFWCSSRDMVHRERVMSGQSLRYEQLMDFVNKSSHEAETVYNTGFAFTKHLVESYGIGILYDLSKELGKFSSFTFEKAFRKVTGENAEDHYNSWLISEKERYRSELKDVLEIITEGENISDSAFVNSNPKLSPDMTKLAYLSTKDNGEATYYRRNIYIKDLNTDSVKMAVPSVLFSSYSWSPDGGSIYFSRIAPYSIYGYQYFDIYVYDLESKKETQITHGLRAANPAVSPNGEKIAYVSSNDGSRNLFIYHIDDERSEQITFYEDGTQFYQPGWNRDGTAILVDRSGPSYGRSIVQVLTDGTETVLFDNGFDNRDPVYSRDFSSVYFSGDRTGIYNIYKLDIASGDVSMVTNVRGGAFNPEPAEDGLIYINYKGIKSNVYRINSEVYLNSPVSGSEHDYRVLSGTYYFEPDLSLLETSKKYSNDFEQLLMIPRIAFDGKKFKPGMYFFVNDYLEKISFFAGFGASFDGDYDIFGMAEYRFLLPTLYGMAINVVKNDKNTFLDERIIVGEYQDEQGNWTPVYQRNNIEFKYDLKEFNFGIRTPMHFMPKMIRSKLGNFSFDGYFALLRNDAKADYGDFILNYTYFKEKSYNFNFDIERSRYDFNYYINPVFGRKWRLTYSRHDSDFIQGFKLNSDYGTLQEDYKKYNYNRFSADIRENFKLPYGSGMTLRFKGSYIDNEDIDPFYYNYIGGITGLKGYSFYSIGGTRTAFGGIYLRFPLIGRTDKRIGFFNFKNLFAGIFGETGSAWVEDPLEDVMKDLKMSVGMNIRLFGTLFYGFPVSAEYTLAYGLDSFENEGIAYGREFRNYFTLLFDFPDF